MTDIKQCQACEHYFVDSGDYFVDGGDSDALCKDCWHTTELMDLELSGAALLQVDMIDPAPPLLPHIPGADY